MLRASIRCVETADSRYKQGMGSDLPGVFRSLESALTDHGYLAIVLLVGIESFGVPAPGQTVLVAAGIYAGTGRLDAAWVAVAGFLAATGGDAVGYAIGRFGGRRVVLRFGRYLGLTEPRLDKIEGFFGRHGGKVVPVARFVDGLRQFNGVAAGLANMPAQRFLVANAAGAAAWVGVCVTVGFVAGNHIGSVYETIRNYQLYLLVTVGVLALGLVVRWLWRSRRTA